MEVNKSIELSKQGGGKIIKKRRKPTKQKNDSVAALSKFRFNEAALVIC
jgi:hypothetical protein